MPAQLSTFLLTLLSSAPFRTMIAHLRTLVAQVAQHAVAGPERACRSRPGGAEMCHVSRGRAQVPLPVLAFDGGSLGR